jgi:hypothetical protein
LIGGTPLLTENHLNNLAEKLDMLPGQKIQIQFEIDDDKETLNFILYPEKEFEEAQIGYRMDEQGKSLIGNKSGDWEDGWFVIGYDEDLGDPLFVDTSDSFYPVLTADKGLGEWEPSVLFDSFDEFLKNAIFK